MQTVELLNNHGFSFVGPVKTAKKNFPKLFLEETMKNWSGGMSLVMEGRTASGVEVLAIGYKYNSTKVLCFVATKDAGSTLEGIPYNARYKDGYGNGAARKVPRPDIISRYFAASNVVDKHNQARQFELALEKHWVTTNCWFRIVTSIIGITVTDAWKAFKYNNGKVHADSDLPIREFADRLVWEMMDTDWDKYSDFPAESDPEDIDEEDNDVADFSPPPKHARTASVVSGIRRAPEATNAPIDSVTELSQAEVSDLTQDSLHTLATAAQQQQQNEQQQQPHLLMARRKLIFDDHDVVDYAFVEGACDDDTIGRQKRGKCGICRKNTTKKCRQCNVALCVMNPRQRLRDCWQEYHNNAAKQCQQQDANDGSHVNLD